MGRGGTQVRPSNKPGSLTFVGTGIQAGFQTTQEARLVIEGADKVLHLLDDPVARSWIEKQNPSAQSLDSFYALGKPRKQTYQQIVEAILEWVRSGLDVGVALYGHPGVFVAPSHEAVRRAREEGFEARMLPAVSSEDCLVVDLGLDPGERGWQTYEATAFLLYPPTFDPNVPLVLWQVSAIGNQVGTVSVSRSGLQALAERLQDHYGPDHETILYEASPYPIVEPMIQSIPLKDLPDAEVASMSTLYVPPKGEVEADEAMFDRLGISPS